MAAVKQVGDVHPKNPNLVWTEYQPGKFDWRNKNAGKPQGVKPMNSQQLATWAPTAKTDSLVTIAQAPNLDAQKRKVAYDELEKRGYDMSTIDTSGTLDKFLNNQKKVNNLLGNGNPTPSSTPPVVNDETHEDDDVTEEWWLNKTDARVKKNFNLATKSGRIKYDHFLDKMKKKQKNYKNPVRVMQDLARQYAYFLKNDKARFMISAGGAGIGKTYQFKVLSDYFNIKPFDSTKDAPGDGDYGYFEAPNVSSAKQLAGILKSHNGKLILFDDNDAVLTDKRCAAMMKKATATGGKRIVDDPEDKTINFEFTGRIMIMTNKDLATLSENEDTKAVISRATGGKSEIYLTVSETIDVLRDRFQKMEFDTVDRLDDPNEDVQERVEVFHVIEKNSKNIDPAQFTVRNFESMILVRRAAENGNAMADDAAINDLIGTHKQDWEEEAGYLITKAQNDELFVESTEDFSKAVEEEGIVEEQEVEKAVEEEFSVNFDDMDIEKAETLLFGE